MPAENASAVAWTMLNRHNVSRLKPKKLVHQWSTKDNRWLSGCLVG